MRRSLAYASKASQRLVFVDKIKRSLQTVHERPDYVRRFQLSCKCRRAYGCILCSSLDLVIHCLSTPIAGKSIAYIPILDMEAAAEALKTLVGIVQNALNDKELDKHARQTLQLTVIAVSHLRLYLQRRSPLNLLR